METYILFAVLLIGGLLTWGIVIRKDKPHFLLPKGARDNSIYEKNDRHLARIPQENHHLLQRFGIDFFDFYTYTSGKVRWRYCHYVGQKQGRKIVFEFMLPTGLTGYGTNLSLAHDTRGAILIFFLEPIPEKFTLFYRSNAITNVAERDLFGVTVDIDEDTLLSAKDPDKAANLIEVDKLEQAKSALEKIDKSSFMIHSGKPFDPAKVRIDLPSIEYFTAEDIDIFIDLIESIEREAVGIA